MNLLSTGLTHDVVVYINVQFVSPCGNLFHRFVLNSEFETTPVSSKKQITL